ncbi:hypothetical protein FDI24_gp055 [Acidovorax phage ACP17]|uniref:Uncharacterized protein n=1 Tax=Acidovorax phage ACP17 TaxID=2010329 RepID=A0A223AIY1_9CAUD|nr:hypothetical protein FDI24_gp055 [Acidovorax phage ACP17]ASS33922.1 hypothetical protein [Acidovorax phage ACP17]
MSKKKSIQLRKDLAPSGAHRFLCEHSDAIKGRPGFRVMHKPMVVYKATLSSGSNRCLVELEIPVGAEVYSMSRNRMAAWNDRDDRKMRCSSAKVLRQWTIGSMWSGGNAYPMQILSSLPPRAAEAAKESFSSWDRTFVYANKKVVKPKGASFSLFRDQCDAGIHFFVNPGDALIYSV